jgi:hypothetical protein
MCEPSLTLNPHPVAIRTSVRDFTSHRNQAALIQGPSILSD